MKDLIIERTHYCADVVNAELGTLVRVAGWVRKRRDLGNLIFIDLYDRTGILQAVFDPEKNPELMDVASNLKRESVVTIEGKISPRPKEALNPEMITGSLELIVTQMQVHNTSALPPFHLLGDQEVSDELRLKYRYIDLRRPEMFKILDVRHKTMQVVRKFYSENGFLEVTTPHLIRSTPEGARDFLVPSRLYPGKCYALPQSPQIFKQLLMIAGADRYFQIVKCFRDEDSRADRQPEFSQIDVEMSFTTLDTLFKIHENLIAEIYRNVLDYRVELPFPRISYHEAILKYGTDKPDLRFGLQISDVTDSVRNTGFKILDDILSSGGVARALSYPGGSKLSRKEISELELTVKQRGAGGLIAIKLDAQGNLSGNPLAKLIGDAQKKSVLAALCCEPGDLICMVAGKASTVAASLGALRNEIAHREKLHSDEHKFLWVTDFPLVEYNEEDDRYYAMHHPFTSPVDEDVELLDSHPEKCRAKAYDMVLNGVELGGGSVRIHREDIQSKVFKAIGLSRDNAESQFGFLLNALRYGAPPHCGIAFGFDRIVMMLVNTSNLQDVIPFPKTLQAACLLTEAPSPVTDEQLMTLHLSSTAKKKKQE